MNYYAYCDQMDIIGRMKNKLLGGGFKLRPGDGKLVAEQAPPWNTPWHYVEYSYDIDCVLWNGVVFEELFRRRFVPSWCQNCYKVVVRPRTLSELFKLLAVQKQMEWPSKCGIEVRKDVPHLYGGYYYCKGLDEGKECYEAVRKNVDEYISPDVKVILKRGCTEYERACGPSDKWEVKPEQIPIEDLVRKYIVWDSNRHKQPEHVIAYVHKTWIEFACQSGDMTYLEFTDNQPLYPPYVTYHNGEKQG